VNRDDTARLLRVRSALTSQPYGDEAIDAWHEVLKDRDFAVCRTAMVDASKTDKRITVAHLLDRLPQSERHRVDPPEACELCDGSGWVSIPSWRAHNPRHCRPTEALPCACHACEPCRCSTGRRMVDVQRRINQHNAETRPPWLHDEPDPADPRRLDLDAEQLRTDLS
jgi:hypothetical protein